MARVFLSHVASDKPTVRRIAAALRAAGHKVALDEDEIPVSELLLARDELAADDPAADVGTEVSLALELGAFVVICLSKAAAERWGQAERDPILIQHLREEDERILVVRLEDVAPPHLVTAIAHVDLFSDEQAFARGLAWLTRSIGVHRARDAATGAADALTSLTVADTEPSVSPRRRSREVPARFLVALSFSGVEREFVRSIAEAVERRLGPSSVFFDEWYEFYIGGHDADLKLQRIYGAACELAVVCVCATYGSKAWTRAEHEAIRSRLMQARAEEDPRQRERIFPIRVGDGNVDGIPFNAIVSDVRGRTPEQVAELIADRLQFVMGAAPAALEMPSDSHLGSADGGIARVSTSPGSAAPTPLRHRRDAPAPKMASPMPAYLNAEVRVVSEQLERARERKQNLRDAGITTDEVDREILELRRQLRAGGQLRAGDTLGDGRYLLIKSVGSGGFAVVWEAWDRREQQRVAIKVLHSHLASDPQRVERFLRGARVMMDLNHPAVVRVYDPRGEDDALHYFVMELAPGGNLRDAVLGGRIEAGRRLPLILQVGEALADAHRNGLVHRDVKPTNILLDGDGNAKLTDFDLVGAHDTTGGTRTGALGTVVYAAPECLDKPQEATARADVFGLGMTAIFCLSGRDLSMGIFRDPAATITKLDCPVLVRAVIERAVAWEPERRFPDAAAMVDALRRALDAQATPAAEVPVLEIVVDEELDAEADTGPSVRAVIDEISAARLREPLDLRNIRQPANKAACLVVLHGPELGKMFKLNRPQIVIGRSLKADIQITHHAVSRNHCKIMNTGNAIMLRDMGSINGTYVNDEMIDEYVLRDGDFIKVGGCIFKFLSSNNIEISYHEELYQSRQRP